MEVAPSQSIKGTLRAIYISSLNSAEVCLRVIKIFGEWNFTSGSCTILNKTRYTWLHVHTRTFSQSKQLNYHSANFQQLFATPIATTGQKKEGGKEKTSISIWSHANGQSKTSFPRTPSFSDPLKKLIFRYISSSIFYWWNV